MGICLLRNMGGDEATMKTLVFACFVLCVGAFVSGCGSESTTVGPETSKGGSAGSGGQGGGQGGADSGGSGGIAGNAGDAPDDASDDGDTGTDEPEPTYPFQCIFPNTSVNNETWEQQFCGFRKCTPDRGCETNQPGGYCTSDDECLDSTCDLGWDGYAPVICREDLCSPDIPWDKDHVADPCP